ncbi:MAG: tetratricopeptide repeat protein [Ferruginibacter sp.]|nr:tetratricopeptide repeat protein [Ferruginibacter sp.]
MKYLISFLLCILIGFSGNGQATTAGWLEKLDSAILRSSQLDNKKQQRIAKLHRSLNEADQNGLFDRYLTLYEEYYIFNYDSAYTYAKKMQGLAAKLNQPSLTAYSKVKLSFIQLSSGMFKEVFDSLGSMSLQYLSGSQRAEYYVLMARCYYDLADYDHDKFYSPDYNLQANRYIDSALVLFPSHSNNYMYYSGLKNIRSGRNDIAYNIFQQLINRQGLSLHELAVTASTFSDIFIQRAQTDTAIILLIRAAIADIQSSTKETSAVFNLSSLLYRQGNLKNASSYIQKAVDDALFYGARQRKVQLSSILPLIEGEKLAVVEKEKKNIITYATFITLLFVVLIILILVIVRQVNKLKQAKRVITKAHAEQQLINQKLEEANRIKEEYIGYFFNGNSEFYTRMERFKKQVDVKITDRKIDDIKFLVNNLNVKREREELLKNFDRIFLKLFPNFTAEFNTLMKEEGQIKLKEGELLNTDLRIFALIRMGIHEPEKIAEILEYSVNTINTYKTKIKNKSIVPNEEFEKKIMKIHSI